MLQTTGLQALYDLLITHGVDEKTARRFSDKVVLSKNGCWLWQANLGHGGHGRFQWQGKARFAHRWIFQQLYGDAGPSIDHICVQAACVNPDHLQIVTPSRNTQLRFERGPISHPSIKTSGPRLFAIRQAISAGRLCQRAFDALRSKNVSEEEALRFSTKIHMDENNCWLWIGAKNEDGYAHFSFLPPLAKKHKLISGHRWAYTKLIGDPNNFVLDHLCRNRACCNPNHLEPVTRAENTKRGDHKTRTLGITHCPYGHIYDKQNTRITKRGKRCCRTCERNRANAKNTHCVNGHPFDLENLGHRKLSNGKTARYCRTCAKQPRHQVNFCIKGHPYDEKNTWIGKNGERGCRECAKIRTKARKTHCAQNHKYTSNTVEIINGVRRCLLCKKAGPRYTKTHCNSGHKFTLENTGYQSRREGNPYRYCIICSRKRAREYQRGKRSKNMIYLF